MNRDYYRKNRNFGLWLCIGSLVVYYVIVIAGLRAGSLNTLLVNALASTLVWMGAVGSSISASYCWQNTRIGVGGLLFGVC